MNAATANGAGVPDEWQGRTLVVKLGGEIMQQPAALAALAADCAALTRGGVRVVVVHGGGPQADALAARLGHRVRKVAGRRITDDDALEVAKMVYAGSTNVELLAALKAAGARPVGLSGVDGNLITVTRRPPVSVHDPATGDTTLVDFGHVGDVAATDPALLHVLLGAGYVPVVASLAAGVDGALFNVNADTIAAALAVALAADRLVLLTNVPGVLRDPADPASLIPALDPPAVAALTAAGVLTGGMLPKVQNALDALAAGVARVLILDGTRVPALLVASLTGDTLGTMFLPTP